MLNIGETWHIILDTSSNDSCLLTLVTANGTRGAQKIRGFVETLNRLQCHMLI